MSDSRRPTDGELFRRFRPGVGVPTPPPTTRSQRSRRPPPLTETHAALLSLAKRTQSDAQALEFVQWLSRWLSEPHGLAGRPDRAATDAALKRLLYKMSPGEASFHLDKLKRENAERSRLARGQAAKASQEREAGAPCGVQIMERDDPPPTASHLPQPNVATARSQVAASPDDREARRLAAYLAIGVPREDAIRIVALIAEDVGLTVPSNLDADFHEEAATFFAVHVPRERARRFLDELQRRATAEEPWIREKIASDHDPRVRAQSRRPEDCPRAYEPWSAAEEERLEALHSQGVPIDQIARELGRQFGGVRSRLRRLGLVAGAIYLTITPALDLISAGPAPIAG